MACGYVTDDTKVQTFSLLSLTRYITIRRFLFCLDLCWKNPTTLAYSTFYFNVSVISNYYLVPTLVP